MENENKPDVVADSATETTVLPAQETAERIAAVREEQKSGETLTETLKGNTNASTEGTSDVSVQKDSSSTDVASAALQLIEASTGRKFTNVDDAKKYLSNLNSLVGDQKVADARKAAEMFDKWAQQTGKSPDEVRQLADSLISTVGQQEKAEATKPSKDDDRVLSQLAKLQDVQEQLMLERKYPEAVEVSEEIALIAKAKGISYVEAYESGPFKNLMATKKAEESRKSPVVTPSNTLNINVKRVQELGKKALTGTASDADKEALVAEVLGSQF